MVLTSLVGNLNEHACSMKNTGDYQPYEHGPMEITEDYWITEDYRRLLIVVLTGHVGHLNEHGLLKNTTGDYWSILEMTEGPTHRPCRVSR